MLTHRKQARNLLNDLPLESFWQIVRNAKISDEDQVILDLRFVHGWSISKIAIEQHMSEEKVKSVIKRTYNKISNLIGRG